MGNQRLHSRERYYVRKNASGVAIDGSGQWAKRKPVSAGHWVDATECVTSCCSTEPNGSFILFRATSLAADSTLTTITYPGFTWTGTIENGDYLIVPLPYNTAVNVTVTCLVESTAMAIAVSTIQGSGTITSSETVISSDVDPQTFVLSTTSTPDTQYMCIVSDD